MIRRFTGLLGPTLFLALLTVSGSEATAQVPLPDELGKVFDRLTTLLPPEMEAKLNLTAEQKKQLAKLQTEYDGKNTEALSKMPQQLDKAREAAEKVLQNGDIDAAMKIVQELLDYGQDIPKVRSEYQAKLRNLLTAEQQKKYDELQKDAPLLGVRLTDLVPGGLAGRMTVGGPLLPQQAEEKLKLTAEQKTKLAALQKEYDDKSKAAQAKLGENAGKVREGVEKAIQNQDPDAALQALRTAGAQMRESNQLRREYEAKVKEVLNDEQKKQYDELRPRRGLRLRGF